LRRLHRLESRRRGSKQEQELNIFVLACSCPCLLPLPPRLLNLWIVGHVVASGDRKRFAVLALALEASVSRSRGGEFVTSDCSSSWAACATWSTARLKATSLAFEGLVKPLSLRTNCTDEARISSSVAGGLKLCRVLMFRHIPVIFLLTLESSSKTSDIGTYYVMDC